MGLYIMYALILLLAFIIFFFVKFIINFIKINGITGIINSLKRPENIFGSLTILLFTLIFWLSFYFIYYIDQYPNLTISKLEGNNKYQDTIKVNKKRQINLSNESTLTITKYNMEDINFKINTSMYKLEYDRNGFDYLKLIDKNEEYKLDVNRDLILYSLDKKVTYTLELRG